MKHPIPAEALKESIAIVGRLGSVLVVDARLSVPLSIFARFESRTVVCGECWQWSGGLHSFGYGRTIHEGRPVFIHRLAFALWNGAIPDGLEVLHECDNPPCWNPAHLFLGTQLDNIADMHAKGRGATPPVRRGEANHKVHVPDARVESLRAAWKATQCDQRALAKQFGVSQSTAWRWIHGHTRAS